MDWRRVLGLWDEDRTNQLHLSVRDVETGAAQTLITTGNHPFFVQTTRLVANSSEGHVYAGPLADGYWVDAVELVAGDHLLNDDGSWAEVIVARLIEEPLLAYSLTVEGFHIYFVAANENASPVWVHNNCWDQFPEGARPTGRKTQDSGDFSITEDGQEIYQGADGRWYARWSGELQDGSQACDQAAHELADLINGKAQQEFASDIDIGKVEFDAISNTQVGQAKGNLTSLGSAERNQAKLTFQMASETNRSVVYSFPQEPTASVVRQLQEYAIRYNVQLDIIW